MRKFFDFWDNLDKLYRDVSMFFIILESSRYFIMSEFDRYSDELKIFQNEVLRFNSLMFLSDSVISELRVLKKFVSQELEVVRYDAEVVRCDIKVLEDDRDIMKVWCDKAMDKVVRVGRILMKSSGVVVSDDIVADVFAVSVFSSNFFTFGDFADKVFRKDVSVQ